MVCCLDFCSNTKNLAQPNRIPLHPVLLALLKSSSQTTLLSRGPSKVLAYSWAVGFSSLPVYGTIQIANHIFPKNSGSSHPLDTTNLLQALAVHFAPECIPHPMHPYIACAVLLSWAVSKYDSYTIVDHTCLLSGVVCFAIILWQGSLPPECSE